MKKKVKKQIKLVEIARSFSYKLNLGNYQMADFFCSQKSEASPTQAKKISEKLFKFCQEAVEKSIEEYLAENKKEEPKKEPPKLNRQDFAKAAKEAPARQAEQELVDSAQEEAKQEEERERENATLTQLAEENN